MPNNNNNKGWVEEHNVKLLALLNKGPRRGIDYTNLNKDYVEKVIKKHFPSRTYANLNQLYRRKVRAYALNSTLKDGRKLTYKDGKFKYF